MLMLMLMYNSVFALEEEWQQENKTNSNWKSGHLLTTYIPLCCTFDFPELMLQLAVNSEESPQKLTERQSIPFQVSIAVRPLMFLMFFVLLLLLIYLKYICAKPNWFFGFLVFWFFVFFFVHLICLMPIHKFCMHFASLQVCKFAVARRQQETETFVNNKCSIVFPFWFPP